MKNVEIDFNQYVNFELVFQDAAMSWRRLLCDIKEVHKDKIVTLASNSKNNFLQAPRGAKAFMNIYTSNGIYTSDVKILEVQTGSNATQYVLSYPVNTRHSQRREFFRADIKVRFIASVKRNSLGKVEIISGQTRNLCGRGLSFCYPIALRNCQSIEVTFTLDGRTIKTSAQVIYSRMLNISGSNKYLQGLNFIDISQHDLDYIVKKCFLYQLNDKRLKAKGMS